MRDVRIDTAKNISAVDPRGSARLGFPSHEHACMVLSGQDTTNGYVHVQ
jgi:hypothetical protein